MGLNIEPTNANTETSTTNICQLPELRAVDLSWNQISSFRSGDLDQVADKLERLNLRGNRLGILSDDALVAMTSLRDLNLADNQLAALPPTLFSSASLQSLESLQLQNNSLTMLTPGLFAGLSQLVMLNLSHNAIASHLLGKGTSINYVDKHGERGLAKCQRYYISLCSKFVNEGGGIKNSSNLLM